MTDAPDRPPERLVFVEEAVVRLAPTSDEAAVGAAVTVALCGHWDHPGACRWPHNTSVTSRVADLVTVATLVVATADDEVQVRSAIRGAVGGGRLAVAGAADSWTVVSQRRRSVNADEAGLARRLRSHDREP